MIHTSRIGKRLSMASITRVCARSRPSMTQMTSSMLPRLLGVMSGKLRVRGGCVRCRHDGVRGRRLGRWDKGKMTIDAVSEGWEQHIRRSDDLTIAITKTRTDDHERFCTSSVQNTNSKFLSSAVSLMWRLRNILPAAWPFKDAFLSIYYPPSCIDHSAPGAYPSCSSRGWRTACAQRTCSDPISYHWSSYPEACAFITAYSSVRCIDGTIAKILQSVEIRRSWHRRWDFGIYWRRNVSGVRASGNF